MVTEIILNEDIHPHYLDIDNWIDDGITHHSVWCCLRIYRHYYIIDCDWFKVRNIDKNLNNPIHSLNKW